MGTAADSTVTTNDVSASGDEASTDGGSDTGTEPVDETTDCTRRDCIYVRSGAGGDGSAWSSALSELPADLERGAVYLVAAGQYAAYTFDDPAGPMRITVQKATPEDHGSDDGWSDTMGVEPAVFSGWTIATSGLVLDGTVGGGPGQWVSGHGFEVTKPIPTQCSGAEVLVRFLGDVDDVSIAHARIFAPSNDYPVRGIDATTGTASRVAISHVALHTLFTQAIYIREWSDSTLEYSYVGDVRSTGEGDPFCENLHGEAVATLGTNSAITLRYNAWDRIEGTAVLAGINSGISANWEVYGNVFARSTTAIYYYDSGTNAQSMVGLRFYNNTIVGMPGSSMGGIVIQAGDDNVVHDNLWYDNVANSFQISGDHDYNLFVDNRREEGCSPTCPLDAAAAGEEAHGALSEAQPFEDGATDPLLNEFRLANPTVPGLALESPFDEDMWGTVRGQDGGWDRGASEFL